MASIVERLITARYNAGLSQGQAAKLIGMSQGGLCDIEKGRNSLPMERFLDLCKAYGISEAWALTGVNPDFDASDDQERAGGNRAKK